MYCRNNNFGSKIEIEEIDQLGSQMSLVCIFARYLISYEFFDIFFSQGAIWRTYNISSRNFASFSIRIPVGWPNNPFDHYIEVMQLAQVLFVSNLRDDNSI